VFYAGGCMFLLNKLKHWFKKNSTMHDLTIYAPISGHLTPIEQTPDAIFATKIIGDGIAIEPTQHHMVAPFDGVLYKIYPQNHAFSIRSQYGLEIIVHFGIDSIELNGEGFKRLVEEGTIVQAGTPIIECHFATITPKIKSIITPVVIINGQFVSKIVKLKGTVQAGIDPILQIQHQSSNKK
jgi:sugar PTS system EIIA component